MQMLAKGMLAALWLVLVPGAAGVPYMKKKKNFTVGECFLAGYLFLFCLGEVILLPACALDLSLSLTSLLFGTVLTVAALYGLWTLKGCWKGGRATAGKAVKETRKNQKEQKSSGIRRQIADRLRRISPFMYLAILMITVQVVIASFYAHMDADDAFYVGTATAAVETNTLFSIDPYTGFAYKVLPKRYALSPFPVLLAVISRLCGGLHPAILAHVVYPIVFLPMVYVCFYYLGRKYFREDGHARGLFLMFTAVLTWFSGFSVYTSGNFTLVRLWQGKAMLAGLLLPFTLYLCLCTLMETEEEYSYLLLFMANLACCHVSSMGIMLSPIMIGTFALIAAVKKHSFMPVIKGVICCLPSLILGVGYLFL